MARCGWDAGRSRCSPGPTIDQCEPTVVPDCLYVLKTRINLSGMHPPAVCEQLPAEPVCLAVKPPLPARRSVRRHALIKSYHTLRIVAGIT